MPSYLLSVKDVLFGQEHWSFLAEVALRSAVMFCIVLVGLRLLGKRGVKQLSVFELVVIITLGSAAGDPMFYKEVGILPATIVFVMIVVLYRLIMYIMGKSKWFEKLLEGESVCLIEKGSFSVENFKKEDLAKDEFFSELRQSGVTQLGQVKNGIIETNGELSLFFYEDDEVLDGLPIWPGEFEDGIEQITKADKYACNFCGYTVQLGTGITHCKNCKHKHWVKSTGRRRVT